MCEMPCLHVVMAFGITVLVRLCETHPFRGEAVVVDACGYVAVVDSVDNHPGYPPTPQQLGQVYDLPTCPQARLPISFHFILWLVLSGVSVFYVTKM